jgi:hypothetical protein
VTGLRNTPKEKMLMGPGLATSPHSDAKITHHRLPKIPLTLRFPNVLAANWLLALNRFCAYPDTRRDLDSLLNQHVIKAYVTGYQPPLRA